MAENNLSPDSNSIKSDEVYLSETEKNITICESLDETLEDNKTSNERNVSNVSQENLSWKGNEKIHKIADKEQKLSDFINSLKSTEHPIQGPENKPCLLESLPENVQQCKERKCDMSHSLESNVEKKCTTETEESITDTGKNENDSGSKSVERIEHPSQKHGNDTCFLEPLLEKAQPCKGKEFEMSKSIELNVDKICTAYEDEQKIETDQEKKEDDSESKLLESIEHLTQKHGNDACFLQPVPEKAQMNEENEFEMSKSVELNFDKTSTNGTEKSIIDTGKNENDSGCKSMEHIEPPPQDHGKDACFLEPVPEKAQPFEERVSEMSKSIELKVDKIWRASEEESIIRTDQEGHEDDSASNNIKTSIERTGRSEDSQINEKSSIVWNTQTENKYFSESGKLAATKNEEEFEKSTDFKSVQTNCEVNNHPFRFKKAEQFIGDSCAANPISINKVQCAIRLPVSKSLPKRELNKATKSATYVLNETVYCTNHRLPVRYWCPQCITAKCGRCVNVVYSRTCANHLVITMSEHVEKREKTQMANIQAHSKACLKELESNMNVLKQNEQITQELIQKERIQQEFVSLHELLIEEEMKILQKLGKSFEEYTLQNRSVERTFGSVVKEEAILMCKSLDHINKYDHYGHTVTAADAVLNTEWSQLGVKVHNVFESLKPIPRILQDRFTMQKIKVDLKAQFSTVLDPVEVHPIQFTLYLDGKDITTPFKVSDLFLCKNSLYSFTEIELEVEINCKKISMMKEKIKLNDYILNSGDKPYLKENQRYIVKARACSGFNELKYVNQRVRNVLIVTGCKPISSTTEYLMTTDRSTGRYNTLNEQYLKWKESKLWPFSSVRGCEAFYDVSPEELRATAYSATYGRYNCNTADKEELKAALDVSNTGRRRKKLVTKIRR